MAKKIIIAEDHKFVATFASNLLRGFDVVAVAKDGGELIELTNKYEPDLIISDIEMKPVDGLTAIQVIKEKFDVRTAIITAKEQRNYILEARKIGVNAFMLKRTTTPEDFLNIIQIVMSTDCHIEGDGVAEIMSYKQEKTGLTKREGEILADLGEGLQNNEIAEKRFISPHTVKNHLENIKEKLRDKDGKKPTREKLIAGVSRGDYGNE